MIKHNVGMMGTQSNHLSIVKITDKEFFYTSKWDPLVHEGDLFNKFSLFGIRFIKGGMESDGVKSLRKVDPSFCFELCTDDGKGIIFEIPMDDKLEKEQIKEAKRKNSSGGKQREVCIYICIFICIDIYIYEYICIYIDIYVYIN
jgi:hypothetical protein